MRILDCKNEKCHALAAGAPKLAECLDEDCKEHFAKVQKLLTASGVDFVIDPTLVRGLDYYTRTAGNRFCHGNGAGDPGAGKPEPVACLR